MINIYNEKGKLIKTQKGTDTNMALRNYPIGYTAKRQIKACTTQADLDKMKWS